MSTEFGNSWAIANLRHPTQGAKAIQRNMDFTATEVINDDLLTDIMNGHIDFIQSIKIDNSQSDVAFSITFFGIGVAGDTIIAGPNQQLIYPVFVPIGENVRYQASSTSGLKIPVTMFNIPLPYFANETVVEKTGVITGNVTNHSAAIAVANTSQIAVPANANRMRVTIQNPPENAASFWVSEGTGNLATEGFGSQEILPGQGYDTGAGPVQLGDVNIIGIVQNYFAQEIHS
jgi:hypothetical protein